MIRILDLKGFRRSSDFSSVHTYSQMPQPVHLLGSTATNFLESDLVACILLTMDNAIPEFFCVTRAIKVTFLTLTVSQRSSTPIAHLEAAEFGLVGMLTSQRGREGKEWRARRDLNPGSPAPQASVLIQSRSSGTRIQDDSPKPDTLTRLRAHTEGIRHEGLIINTLLQMKNSGLAENTLKTVSQKLNQLGKHADLMNSQDILTYIANSNVTNATKQKLANSYNYFCITNKINWKKPTYKWERKVPLIPTTENIYKIIGETSKKFATIFTILEETGLEGQELATTSRRDIDTEKGIINVQGCKGHNSRSLKLKPKTADLLRAYTNTMETNHSRSP
jgi:hypothetical protein